MTLTQAAEQANGKRVFHDLFATTDWAIVGMAGEHVTPKAVDALGKLYVQYYYPLYAYVRRRGHSPEDSDDLTQSFFVRLLERNFFRDVVQERGKFRAFLLTAFKHCLNDEWDRTRTQKRGGNFTYVPLVPNDSEIRYSSEIVDGMTPERLFELKWVNTLLESALKRLEWEHRAEGASQLDRYIALQPYLTGDRGAPSYAETAAKLGISTGATSSAVSRIRERYQTLLKQELLRTVASPSDLREEVAYILAILD